MMIKRFKSGWTVPDFVSSVPECNNTHFPELQLVHTTHTHATHTQIWRREKVCLKFLSESRTQTRWSVVSTVATESTLSRPHEFRTSYPDIHTPVSTVSHGLCWVLVCGDTRLFDVSSLITVYNHSLTRCRLMWCIEGIKSPWIKFMVTKLGCM